VLVNKLEIAKRIIRMAIEMSPFEISRWNSDDQAVALLADAHWTRFFDEPKYANKAGGRSRKRIAYGDSLARLHRAATHLQAYTPIEDRAASPK
jgi:hypothetical protein